MQDRGHRSHPWSLRPILIVVILTKTRLVLLLLSCASRPYGVIFVAKINSFLLLKCSWPDHQQKWCSLLLLQQKCLSPWTCIPDSHFPLRKWRDLSGTMWNPPIHRLLSILWSYNNDRAAAVAAAAAAAAAPPPPPPPPASSSSLLWWWSWTWGCHRRWNCSIPTNCRQIHHHNGGCWSRQGGCYH